MFNTLERYQHISYKDYVGLAHAALGPLAYASLGAAVLSLSNQESYPVRDAAMIGLVSSVPSVLVALTLRWVPPCQSITGCCLNSLGKVQHVFRAVICGLSTGIGESLSPIPVMSASQVMTASEVGVGVSVAAVALGLLLKRMPADCRRLKARCWPSEKDAIRMPSDADDGLLSRHGDSWTSSSNSDGFVSKAPELVVTVASSDLESKRSRAM